MSKPEAVTLKESEGSIETIVSIMKDSSLRLSCEWHEILPLHFVQGFGSFAQNDMK